MWVQFLGQEDPLEKEMVTQSNILAWRIPWTEEPCGLQSVGAQKSQTWLGSLRTATYSEGEWRCLLIVPATFIHVYYLPGPVGFLSLDFLIYKPAFAHHYPVENPAKYIGTLKTSLLLTKWKQLFDTRIIHWVCGSQVRPDFNAILPR